MALFSLWLGGQAVKKGVPGALVTPNLLQLTLSLAGPGIHKCFLAEQDRL